MKRWLKRQWNLRRRAFLAWRQRFARWCVEFYVTERAVFEARRKKPITFKPGDLQPGKKIILVHKGAVVAKVSRQLRRKVEREQGKEK